MNNEKRTISSFLFGWWRLFVFLIFVEIFTIIIVSVFVIQLLIVSVVIIVLEFVFFNLLVALSVESVQNFKLWEPTLLKILRLKHFFSVVVQRSDWIVAKVHLLQVFELGQWLDAVNFGNVVLVEDQLTQIWIFGQFGQFAVTQSTLKAKRTCFLWSRWRWGHRQGDCPKTQVRILRGWGSLSWCTFRWLFLFIQ